MTVVEERTLILTAERVEAINRARDVLFEMERAAMKAAWTTPRDVLSDMPSPQSLGRLAGAMDAASDALFNVLNIARSHACEPLTDAQVHNHKDDGQ